MNQTEKKHSKLIASLMGITVVDTRPEIEIKNQRFIDDLQYLTSWDWLMPAYKKVRKMYHGAMFPEISQYETIYLQNMKEAVINADLENLAHSIASLILWRNENRVLIKTRKKY